ncbi:hypothetical protein GOBAR_DD06684 [Gossypium barbadense]|nr:hypothetical protein GOBAR_DD06684 [Gossypium barbadense]
MARLPLIGQSVMRKRIGIALTIWLQICRIASWFLLILGAIHSLHTYRPRIRSYILDFYTKRDYVKRLINASDETCIEQVRMNRISFFKLCEMLQTLGGLKSSRNMLVDEQVEMFLHIISHHLKNRIIKHHFNRSGDTVSRSFHHVLNVAIRLQDVLFKKVESITVNSTDPRWKWFKNCLGALDGTHIKIKVPTVDKPRYQTRKDCYYLVDVGYTNCEGFLAPFRGQRFHLNEWRQGVSESNVSSQTSRGTKRKWVPEEDVALVSHMVDLHNVETFNADTGFKAGYLNELEKMLEKALPNAMLKARPNIESRIKVLKRDWSIVYDMLNGQNNSGFGWDKHRQLVVAEDAVWNSYLNDVPTTDINEERNEIYDCEADVSLDDMDVSTTEPQPDSHQGGSTSSKKKKRILMQLITFLLHFMMLPLYWRKTYGPLANKSERLLTNAEQCKKVSRKILHARHVGVSMNPVFTFLGIIVMHERFGNKRILQFFKSSWYCTRSIKQRPSNFGGSSRNHIMYQVWNPPPPGSFKLNVDGARILSLGLAFLTAVARDEYGRWMWGIGHNIERFSVEKTELWAIYDVLRVARDPNWDRYIIETDCALAIKGIHKGIKC